MNECVIAINGRTMKLCMGCAMDVMAKAEVTADMTG